MLSLWYLAIHNIFVIVDQLTTRITVGFIVENVVKV